jgi:hypothetical protein
MTKLNALLFRFLPCEAHYGFSVKATRELADAGATMPIYCRIFAQQFAITVIRSYIILWPI